MKILDEFEGRKLVGSMVFWDSTLEQHCVILDYEEGNSVEFRGRLTGTGPLHFSIVDEVYVNEEKVNEEEKRELLKEFA